MITKNTYFTESDIRNLLKLKGSRLTKVTYYVWVNRVKETDSLSLEWLELQSENNSKIVLGADEASGGIRLVEGFTVSGEREKVKQEFGDKMAIEAIDLTISEEWDPSLPLLDIRFMSNAEEKSYMNNCLFFDFGEHRLEISVSGEGLYVGLVEENEN
jgi:hypothetical protein